MILKGKKKRRGKKNLHCKPFSHFFLLGAPDKCVLVVTSKIVCLDKRRDVKSCRQRKDRMRRSLKKVGRNSKSFCDSYLSRVCEDGYTCGFHRPRDLFDSFGKQTTLMQLNILQFQRR